MLLIPDTRLVIRCLFQVVETGGSLPTRPEGAHELVEAILQLLARVACAECGKKKKTLWTMLCSFQALDMGMLVPKRPARCICPWWASVRITCSPLKPKK